MKIKDILEKKKLDFALFYNLDYERVDPNLFYFSNYSGIGAIVIPKKKKPFLIAPKMEYLKAKKSNIKKVYQMDKKKFFETILEKTKTNKLKTKNIGIDNKTTNLAVYKLLKKSFKKTKDISSECLKLREVKTNKEIQILRKSCNYSDKILKKTINNFKDFKTESEVAAFLEYETKKLGLGLSFSPIVASGKNAAEPHHEPKNVKLKKGFCVIDFGVKYQGYCSDTTRTIYLGKSTKKEKEIYGFMLGLQKNLIKNIKLNDNCGEIYKYCVKNLKNYAKYFTHGLGHGVGVEIHELPNLTLDSKDEIKTNQVFTIEPGIYLPNKLGIRIEDTILMKEEPEILTKINKNLTII